MATSAPAASSAATAYRPMNPAPPSTSTRTRPVTAPCPASMFTPCQSEISVLTEIYARTTLSATRFRRTARRHAALPKSPDPRPAADDRLTPGRASFRPPLGRDGFALGRQPHGVADPRVAVLWRPADARRGACRTAAGGPLQRQHQPARACRTGSWCGWCTRSAIVAITSRRRRTLGAVATIVPRAQGARVRSHHRGAAGVCGRSRLRPRGVAIPRPASGTPWR